MHRCANEAKLSVIVTVDASFSSEQWSNDAWIPFPSKTILALQNYECFPYSSVECFFIQYAYHNVLT